MTTTRPSHQPHQSQSQAPPSPSSSSCSSETTNPFYNHAEKQKKKSQSPHLRFSSSYAPPPSPPPPPAPPLPRRYGHDRKRLITSPPTKLQRALRRVRHKMNSPPTHYSNTLKPSSKLQSSFHKHRPKTTPSKVLQKPSPPVAPSRINIRVKSMGNITPVCSSSSSSSSVSSSLSLPSLKSPSRFFRGSGQQPQQQRRRRRRWRCREGGGRNDHQSHDCSSTDSSSFVASSSNSSSSSSCSSNAMTDHNNDTAVEAGGAERGECISVVKGARGRSNTSHSSKSGRNNRVCWYRRSSKSVLDGTKVIPSSSGVPSTTTAGKMAITTAKKRTFGDLHYILAAKLIPPLSGRLNDNDVGIRQEERGEGVGVGEKLEDSKSTSNCRHNSDDWDLGNYQPYNNNDNHKVNNNDDKSDDDSDEYDNLSIITLDSTPNDYQERTRNNCDSPSTTTTTPTSTTAITTTTTVAKEQNRQRRKYEEITEWNNLGIEASSRNQPGLASSYFRTAHRLWNENIAGPTAMAAASSSAISVSSTMATVGGDGGGGGGGDDCVTDEREREDEDVEDSNAVTPPPFREIRFVISENSKEVAATTNTSVVRSNNTRIKGGLTAAAVREYVRRRRRKGKNDKDTVAVDASMASSCHTRTSSSMAIVAGGGGNDSVTEKEREREEEMEDDHAVTPPCSEIRVVIPDNQEESVTTTIGDDRSNSTVTRGGREDVTNEDNDITRGDGETREGENDEETVIVDNYSSSSPPTQQRGYIYQRIEFDEGMHAFQHVEPLPYQHHHISSSSTTKESITANTNTTPTDGGVVISTTLWYNRSVEYSRLHEWSNAYHCLEEGMREVLDALSPMFNDDSMMINDDDFEDNYDWYRTSNLLSISVCIMINLGRMQYRRGDFRHAIRTYECALEISQRLTWVRGRVMNEDDGENEKKKKEEEKKDDPLTGCILNCLGVLHYHILSESTLSSSSVSSSASSTSSTLVSKTFEPSLLPLRTLSIKDRNFSSSTNDTGTSRTTTSSNCYTNTSTTTATTSTYQKALEYFQAAIQHQTIHQNSTIGTIHNNIGRLHALMHNYTCALTSYQTALTIRATTLGPNSLDYAATAFNAGQSYHQLGLFREALPLYLVFWKVGRRILPESHRDMAVVLSGIAHILQRTSKTDVVRQSAGRHNDSDEMKKNEDELEIEIRTEHASYQTILTLYQRSLTAAGHAFGTSNHPEIAMIYNRLGNFYFESNEMKLAAETYRRGLEIERNVLEDGHGNIVVTLYNLGEIYRRLSGDDNCDSGDGSDAEGGDNGGKWLKKALNCYEEILVIQRRKRRIVASGQRHLHLNRHNHQQENNNNNFETTNNQKKNEIDEVDIEIATTLHILGTTYDRFGDKTSALHYLQSSLLTRRNVFGNDHLEVANTLTSIGSFFLRRSIRLGNALDLFREALEIRLAATGGCLDGNNKDEEDDRKNNYQLYREVALSWYNIALVHWRHGSYEDALKALEETLRVERTVLGDDHRDVGITLCRLGEVCRDMHSTDRSLDYFGQAVEKMLLVVSPSFPAVSDGEEFGRNTQTLPVDDKINNNGSGAIGGSKSDNTEMKKQIIALARTYNEIGNLHLTKGNTSAMMDAFIKSARLYRDVGNTTGTTTTGMDDVVVHDHLYGLHHWSFPEVAPAA